MLSSAPLREDGVSRGHHLQSQSLQSVQGEEFGGTEDSRAFSTLLKSRSTSLQLSQYDDAMSKGIAARHSRKKRDALTKMSFDQFVHRYVVNRTHFDEEFNRAKERSKKDLPEGFVKTQLRAAIAVCNRTITQEGFQQWKVDV